MWASWRSGKGDSLKISGFAKIWPVWVLSHVSPNFLHFLCHMSMSCFYQFSAFLFFLRIFWWHTVLETTLRLKKYTMSDSVFFIIYIIVGFQNHKNKIHAMYRVWDFFLRFFFEKLCKCKWLLMTQCAFHVVYVGYIRRGIVTFSAYRREMTLSFEVGVSNGVSLGAVLKCRLETTTTTAPRR